MARYKTFKTISIGKSQITVVLLAKQLSRTWFDANGANLQNDCLKRVQNVDITKYLNSSYMIIWLLMLTFEPRHEISNNVVCATSKGSDQPAHPRRLIRAFASRLNILGVFSYWPNIILSF